MRKVLIVLEFEALEGLASRDVLLELEAIFETVAERELDTIGVTYIQGSVANEC